MDIFDEKNIEPMLIGQSGDAFNSPDYFYELKLDGIRCIAYLDKGVTELRNKRNLRVASIYPELNMIHKQVGKRCILDGEVIVTIDGKPNFEEIQRRAFMTNQFKIKLASSKYPVSFVAYDILYLDNRQLTDLPLWERKNILDDIIDENERLSVSRYIEEKGIELYNLTVQENLEGIVAKSKESKYYFAKRSKDWIKIKYLQDDDFIVCGYIEKADYVVSLILGQYRDKELLYKGHVTMGISKDDFNTIKKTKEIDHPDFIPPAGNENAIWIELNHVCKVAYMNKNKNGGLRQPVYKGLRDDKTIEECIE